MSDITKLRERERKIERVLIDALRSQEVSVDPNAGRPTVSLRYGGSIDLMALAAAIADEV